MENIDDKDKFPTGEREKEDNVLPGRAPAARRWAQPDLSRDVPAGPTQDQQASRDLQQRAVEARGGKSSLTSGAASRLGSRSAQHVGSFQH